MFLAKRAEFKFSAIMFTNFFGIIAIFWILKSLKKGIFIAFYEAQQFELFGHIFQPAQTEIFAKGVNVINSALVMLLITYCARFVKQRKFFLTMNFVMMGLLALLRLTFDPHSEFSVWYLYLMGDLYVMTMVPSFMAFLNDSVTPESAKRTYGMIGLGGVLGGAFGSSSVKSFINELGVEQWIVGTIIFSGLLCALSLLVKQKEQKRPEIASSLPQMKDQTSLLRGAKKVFASHYLMGIMLIVFLYEIVSSVIDFQFTTMTSALLDGPALKSHFASVYSLINWVAVIVQVAFTTVILTKAELRTALLILPSLLAIGCAVFLGVPSLFVASILPVIDNGLNYSLNQSAREVLYTVSPSRYSAKAFIDVFVNRFAKIVALTVSMGVSLVFVEADSLRWLSLCILGFLVVWIVVASRLGRRFKDIVKK